MKKLLTEMSLDELWKLFPIQLTEHKTHWKTWYQNESDRIACLLPYRTKIHHIGSTSINGIWAKPIIDILMESDLCHYDEIKKILISAGYICMAQTKTRLDFNKGYLPNGFAEKVFHLHLRVFGDNDELYFRDYLNEHKYITKKYEKLKLSLWKEFEYDRDAYTESKSAFVKKYTQMALRRYGKIY